MIRMAIGYVEQVEELHARWANDPAMEYAWISEFANLKWTPAKDTWNQVQYVSVVEEKVVAYYGFVKSQPENYIANIQIIGSFSDHSHVIAVDLRKLIEHLFRKYRIDKMKFCAAVGSPVEPHYDRFVEDLGGRVVGIFKRDGTTSCGRRIDTKWYEILTEETPWFKPKKRRRNVK